MIPTLVHNETNFNNKNCISNANGSSQSTTQSSYLDYWQMLSITNAKPKKKKRCLVFQKLNFLCFLLTIFPQNQLLKYFRQTHYHQEPSRIQNKITQMHTIDLPKPLTCNKQLHKFISTQEEEFLSTNYSFVVFCL
jgi:hypothetical protein